LDPTLLENGLYRVRLLVEDVNGQIAVDERVYRVDGEAKPGLLAFSFIDLEVPVSGIPITVVRSYDSRVQTSGDFGFGWSLQIKTGKYRHNRQPGDGWTITSTGGPFGLPCSLVNETRTHFTEVRLSDREFYLFRPRLINIAALVGGCVGTVVFEFVDGTFRDATLKVLGNDDIIYTSGNTVTEFDGSTDTGLVFDPTRVRLQTVDGRIVDLDRAAGVTRIEDTNGNFLSVTPAGILHSSGKTIAFARDTSGRIRRITDPMGHALRYGYDLRGDLVEFVDQVGSRTTFTYDDRHNLVRIHDPLGNRAVTHEYDANGRLIALVDAKGARIELERDVSAAREVIRDRLGRVSVIDYDPRGNVVRNTDALGHATTFVHDDRDNPIRITNALGETITAEYGEHDKPVIARDPLGNIGQVTYNDRGQVLNTTDANGNVTTNTFDSRGNLVSKEDALGFVTHFTYDSKGRHTSVTDASGGTTQVEHDNNGNVTKATDPLGNVRMYRYDPNGNRLSETRTRTTPAGVELTVTTHQYDGRNRPIETTHPDGSSTRTEYNALGQRSAVVDQLGRRTTYSYDVAGLLEVTNHSDGQRVASTYDEEGRRVSFTDRAGQTTRFEYDAVGRLVESTLADGATVFTAYDAAGRMISTTDPRKNTTTTGYDAAGRRTQVRDAAGNVTTFTYDLNGNVLTTRDARGHTTTFEYDANNRRTRIIHPDGTSEQVGYDALGRAISRTDQEGKTTGYQFDSLGRLVKVVDAAGKDTTYGYDEVGNQIRQTDANGRTTMFEYDQLGRRTKRVLPLGMAERFAYDRAGNLIGKTDFNGMTTTYTYDVVSRLTGRVPDPRLNQAAVTFTYTVDGQRASMTDAGGTTTYAYDSRGQLLSKATPQGTLSYTYDPGGNLTSIRSSNSEGASVDYTYDMLNRLETVTDNRIADGTTRYTYDAVGNLAGYTYPNGVESSFTYNAVNRLIDLTSRRGADVARFGYSLGPSGNRLSVTELSGRMVAYVYDSLYRLTTESVAADPVAANNGSTSYAYDAVGNRLARTSPTFGTVTHTYDANDHLMGHAYDLNGNTTTADGMTFAYDFEDRIIAANGGAIAIVYDGDGNRVAKTVAGTTTRYLVDDLNPTGLPQVLEEIVNGVVQRVYTYGTDLISQNQLIGGTRVASFYGYDGHGSVRYLTDVSGQVTDRYDYDGFGNLTRREGSTPNLYLFSGEQFDPDLGSYYLRARYYNQARGRFVSVDPFAGTLADPMSLHRYLYAHADPVNNTDPTGQTTLQDLAGAVVISSILVNLAIATVKGLVHQDMDDGAPDASIFGLSVSGSGHLIQKSLLSLLGFVTLGQVSRPAGNPSATVGTTIANFWGTVGAAIVAAMQLAPASAAVTIGLEYISSAPGLQAGVYVSAGPALSTSYGSKAVSGMVYLGSAWSVKTLASYRSFPAPAYAAGFAISDGIVGFGFSVFANPSVSPLQIGTITGVTFGAGQSLSAGASISGGPLFVTSNFNAVTFALANAFPPPANIFLVLKAFAARN
jgi:RHS repeat-associated protein